MANGNDKKVPRLVGKAVALSNRNILSAVVSGVELTEGQKAEIKGATGIDVDWLLFHHVSGSAARDIHPSALSVLRVTYCW